MVDVLEVDHVDDESPPLQVFGCADGAIGQAGGCDPVGVAAL